MTTKMADLKAKIESKAEVVEESSEDEIEQKVTISAKRLAHFLKLAKNTKWVDNSNITTFVLDEIIIFSLNFSKFQSASVFTIS